jgi:hopanoid biosynthesis associated RND transporter like protein HpnN
LSNRIETTFASLLSRWVTVVERIAWPIIIVSLLSAVLCGVYAVDNAGVNTDATDMISNKLQFRKEYAAYQAAFDRLRNTVVIVIDGATPDLADEAAADLYKKLEADKSDFELIDQPGGGPFFRRNGLLYLTVDELYDLGDRLAAAQPLLAELVLDESLRGLFDMLTKAADAIVDGDTEAISDLAPVMNELTHTIDVVLEGKPAYFSWQDIMSGEDEVGGVDSRRRFLVVQPVLDYGSIRPARGAIKEIRRLVADLNLTPAHGVTVRLTGEAALSDEELKGITEDAGLAGMISFVLVGIVLFGGLRSPKIAIAALTTIFVGLIWTATFAVAAVGDFNLISVAFAVLFIGLSVDFSIHYGLRFREAMSHGASPRKALARTGGEVGWSLSLCVASTVIAFYSFIPTAYAGVSELGLISGTGMLIALFATMTLLPALLTVLRVRPPTAKRPPALRAKLDRTFARFAWPIVIFAGFAGVAAAVGSNGINFDFDPINLRDPNTESVRTYRDLQRDPNTATDTIKVLEPDLAAAQKVAKKLEALPTVKDAITLASYVPKDQGEKLDIIDGIYLSLLPVVDPTAAPKPAPNTAEQIAATKTLATALERLAESPAAKDLAQPARDLSTALGHFVERAATDPAIVERLQKVVFATLPDQLDRLRDSLQAKKITLDSLPETLRVQQLASDGRARVEVRPAVDTGNENALEMFVAQVQSVAPNATGGPVLIVESGRAVINAFIVASIIATILITTMLVVVLRRPTDVILVLMPLVLACLFTMATAALLDIPFNFANVIVLPLLLGLSVDGGIHMVERDKALDSGQALLQTSTPRAVILSALTTICSFGSLAISSHKGTASMGQLLTIALIYTLISTLIVLPAALNLKARWTKASST